MHSVTFVPSQPLHLKYFSRPSQLRARSHKTQRAKSTSLRKRLFLRVSYDSSDGVTSVPADSDRRERTPQPLLFCLAFVASTVGSLIGAGGGVLLTPFLSALGYPQHNAHGTTLVVITVTALISATKYALAARVSFIVACILSIAAIFTSPVGARYSAKLNGPALKRYFGALLVLVSVMIPTLPHLSEAALPRLQLPLKIALLFGIGSLSGFLNGLLGIGGGTINVPVLILLSFTQKVAQGTALLAMIAPSIRASLVHRKLGHVTVPILPALILGAIVGGFLGSSTAIVLPDKILRLVCSACFAAIGIRYLTRKSPSS